MLKKAKKGAQVIFIPGNHDEAFREYAGFAFGGVEIRLHASHTCLDGRRLLVTHGDEFDAVVQHNKWLALLGSAAYDQLIYLNRIVNWTRRKLGLPHWSLSNYLKRKVKNAISYVRSYEDALVFDARRRGFQGVVCGHIHQPLMKESDGFLYCNTGDWVENCTALVEHLDGKLEILRWNVDQTYANPAEVELDEEEFEPAAARPIELSPFTMPPAVLKLSARVRDAVPV